MATAPSKATRVEDARDLRKEISGLERQDEQEIIFRETSPERRKVTVYNMTNGEPVPIPEYMLTSVLGKMFPNGEPMFTARQERAPEYRMGTTLCFLAEGSAERATLDEIGLSGAICPKRTLSNRHSKRMHALNRHPQEWAAYQEYVEEEKERSAVDRQNKQLEATLALAGRAAPVEASMEAPPTVTNARLVLPVKGECDVCGKTGFKNVGAHKRGAHGNMASGKP